MVFQLLQKQIKVVIPIRRQHRRNIQGWDEVGDPHAESAFRGAPGDFLGVGPVVPCKAGLGGFDVFGGKPPEVQVVEAVVGCAGMG